MYFLGCDRGTAMGFLPKHSVGAEVGVFKGEFARVIHERCDPSELHLIDVWRHTDFDFDNPLPEHASYPALFRAHLKHAEPDLADRPIAEVYEAFLDRVRAFAAERKGVTIHRGLSTEIAKTFPDQYFDFVFIDANHDYQPVLNDLHAYAPKMKPGGLIIGHDHFDNGLSNTSSYGVIDAVNTFTRRTPWRRLAVTSEDFSTYFLATAASDYVKMFIAAALTAPIFTVEMDEAAAANFHHQKIEGRASLLPSFASRSGRWV